MNKIHFHTLEALRFFAFLKVFLSHIPLEAEFPIFSLLKSGGGLGVAFFFVLSGFLITYLLSFEKLNTDTVQIKKFLVRRSLRIFPLYYLVVIVLFALPHSWIDFLGLNLFPNGYALDWRYSFTFFENYKMLFTDSFPKTSPLIVFWSLCIEMQFYVVWILCFYFVPKKHILKFLVGAVVISWLARFVEPYLFSNTNITTNDLFTNLDFFACGGILGYFVAKDYNSVANFVQGISNWIKYLFLVSVIGFVLWSTVIFPYNPGTVFFIFRFTIMAIWFTLLILVFVPQNSKITIRSKVLAYLGNISYGLYVYHLVFMRFCYRLFVHFGFKNDDVPTLWLFVLSSLAVSIVVSAFSYRYFELFFLSLRERVTKSAS